jgi:UDP-glucuronate 4-epimerase
VKILVTGSAGFIGFHLCNALLDDGHVVVGVDNLNSYYSVQLKRDRHSILDERTGFRPVEMDLCDFDGLQVLFDDEGFDVVCHLAAQAGVRHSLTNPFVYQKSNLESFLNVLECCRHASPPPRLVYASSSSVYGGSDKLPLSEADRTDSPANLYAATKKANELMAHSYSRLYGLQTVGFRFFSVYGPWGRPDMAMWLFAEALLAGKPIQVFNHGRMRRDFTYIDDIVAGVMAGLFAEGLEPCEVINLGNHRSEPLMEMIGILADTLGVEAQCEMLPMQPGDALASHADITLARAKLGFEPSTPIRVGIPKFVQWLTSYRRRGLVSSCYYDKDDDDSPTS